ncbi:MAG: hypothetical protein ABSA53_13535 [Streptosporangiaceae bacterium]|jgi:hypothetical protein
MPGSLGAGAMLACCCAAEDQIKGVTGKGAGLMGFFAVRSGRWEPAQLTELVSIFSKMPCPWWVAGGHASELAIGRSIRGHGDIDVMLRRTRPACSGDGVCRAASRWPH